MTIAQISDNLEKLVESFNKESFIFDLLLAYGTPKATISRLQQGDKEMYSEGTVVIKKKLFFKSVVDEDLQTVLNNLKVSDKVIKQAPRFIVVTDYITLLGYDTKTNDSLDIPMLEIPQHNDFFLPWAGMEKSKQQTENIADVRAAERMANLYDEIKKDNPTTTHEEVHNLNVFLSRLLFCFFAEDTDIFDKDLFTKSVDYHTQKDGSDLNVYLDTLFEVMNTPQSTRRIDLPAYLKAFPYVNGGLFRNQHAAPIFNRKSRQMLIDCGLSLQWQDINPDIFGSMIQAVITPEHRGGLGMHYTSVPNIMKVIEPLFLDELKGEFENSKGNKKKLNELLQRIWKIKIFDPACGSGNFLIIAYKELRDLEMQIFKEIDLLKGRLGSTKIDFDDITLSEINLSNFYGIELDDFAHEIATLSLWLAEHQMNQAFKKEFGRSKPSLPLQETGNIVQGNACRLDWETVCPKNNSDEIYILGNPPFAGKKEQNESQKNDMHFAFKSSTGFGTLDYVCIWFYYASLYIKNSKDVICETAFVSTNSIVQGEQVPILWNEIFSNKVKIKFGYKPFEWQNNAKNNASVHVIIIGLTANINTTKHIFNFDGQKGLISKEVKNINPFIIEGNDIIVSKRQTPISKIASLNYGSMPIDNGELNFDETEKNRILETYPTSEKFIRKMVGGYEFLNDISRWCLWIKDNELEEAKNIPPILEKIIRCEKYRSSSGRATTIGLAQKPYKFGEIRQPNKNYIIVPKVSSDRREYIPTSYMDKDIIVSGSALYIESDDICIFGMINSKLFNVWMKCVCGRTKSDPMFSSSIVYNTFPFPPISDKQKKVIEHNVYNILGEREKRSEKTLAELYDPDKMPEGLRDAHRQNDLAVERCYRSKPFESDEERLEYLFKLYEQMIEEEKERGTLFAEKKKSKKKK